MTTIRHRIRELTQQNMRPVSTNADITTGDLLTFATTGAYQYMMASRYNGALRPAVVSVRNGQANLMNLTVNIIVKCCPIILSG